VDRATFVPDGEPTLDLDLGREILGVADLGVRVAVITNGSLLPDEQVRAELMAADLVSIKVDTVDEPAWRSLDRPVGGLSLAVILDGMRRFADAYRGELITETMLVEGLDDDEASVTRTAAFVSALEPARAYLAIPTRPPAESWVRGPALEVVRRAAEIFRAMEVPTTLLVEEIAEHEQPFAVADSPSDGLVGISAVHPMTLEAARDYLSRSGADWSVAQSLLDDGRLVAVRHGGRTYLRAARPKQRQERDARQTGGGRPTGKEQTP
jgi:wyosine [tRNA(Phe)-imidazoG37] synthetase (radical SAM superfamily)